MTLTSTTAETLLARYVEHHVVHGEPQGVAVRGVHATGDCAIEPQTSQMSSDRGVDDVGRRVVLARSAEHGRNIDTRDVRFSHAG